MSSCLTPVSGGKGLNALRGQKYCFFVKLANLLRFFIAQKRLQKKQNQC